MSKETVRKIPKRDQQNPKDCWDLSSLFSDETAWEAGLEELNQGIETLPQFKGSLGSSSEQLKRYLDTEQHLEQLDERLGYWAHLRTNEDAGNSEHQVRFSRYMQTATRFAAETSFFQPELLSIDPQKISEWIAEPAFDDYRIALQKILRFREHTLSKEEEKILAMQAEIRQTPSQVFESLCDVDFDFGSIETEKGDEPLSQSSLSSFLINPDRSIRERAYKQFYTVFENHKNSLASLYSGSIKQDIYLARVRNYPSARAKALFPDKVPETVYDNLLSTIQKHFPLLHRYYRLKKQALGVDRMAHWDVYMPMIPDIKTHYSYDNAVDTVCKALSPLGSEYIEVLRSGLLGGWVDRYENKGKRSGAFSAGSFAGDPYILLNYREDVLRSLFTLAHEGGHSMHSWYSARNNPFPHYQYTIFEAEVASTFNEQLTARYLIDHADDQKTADYIAAKQADDIVATLFRQTMFAEFEAIVHSEVEAGNPMSLDGFRQTYRSLLEKYFGPDVTFIPESDLEGLRIPHFYRAFYVYKYATGIAASISLSERVLNGGQKELDQYLGFLKSGGSSYPIESLRKAGVDMSDAQPIETAMLHFEKLLDRLEAAL